ncbi:MAG: sugar phosphate nucleotidyltransferase [Candidatus Staskawiczbacteria bacterium]|nr:sugar phosphate nucleotidyltransferase [Candidatus Staskawiczbacteria bacterium]
MIKKVVIAAAGQGTRMLQLTKDKSKHLIKVNGKPFLSYVLDNLQKAGYDDFILVVGYESKLMEKFLKDAGYKARVINQFEILGPKEKIYGTACPLMCVKDIGEPFLYICGDNFYSVEDLEAMNVDDNFNYVAGFKNDHPENFGVLLADGDFLDKIVEKPRLLGGQAKEFVGDLINTSLYKFTPEIFEKVMEIEKSPRGEYEVTDAVSLLAQEKKVKINKIKDFWMDFGKPEDVEKLSKFLDENNSKR